MAWLLRLLLLCLWPLGPLSASEILLVGAQDQPGIRSFVAGTRKPSTARPCAFSDHCRPAAPGKLKADQRLILLDSRRAGVAPG